MIEDDLIWSIHLFAPLLALVFLSFVRSDRWRKVVYKSLIYLFCHSFFVIMLFHWFTPIFIESSDAFKVLNISIKDKIFIKPIAYFLGSTPLIMYYLMLIAMGGIAANIRAKRRLKIIAAQSENFLSEKSPNLLDAGKFQDLSDFFKKPRNCAEKVAGRETSGK